MRRDQRSIFHANQQKEWSSGWRFITSRLEKCQNVKVFTVLRLVQKIDHWLELTSSITFIWLLVASQRTVPRSFRGKYAASFSDYVINHFYFLKCISISSWLKEQWVNWWFIGQFYDFVFLLAIGKVWVFGPGSSYVSCVSLWFLSLQLH